MKDFKLTIPNIINLLEKDGEGTKQVLKDRLKNLTDDDLFDLIHSARYELNLRNVGDESKVKMLKQAELL